MKTGLKILLGAVCLGMFGGSMFDLGRIYGQDKESKENAWLFGKLNNIIDNYRKELKEESK